MTGALHVPEHHDLDEAPDVQGVGRRVEPDVARDPAGRGGGVQRLEIRALVEESALDERAQELRTERCGFNRGSGQRGCGVHGDCAIREVSSRIVSGRV